MNRDAGGDSGVQNSGPSPGFPPCVRPPHRPRALTHSRPFS